jgi:hypothetical protein
MDSTAYEKKMAEEAQKQYHQPYPDSRKSSANPSSDKYSLPKPRKDVRIPTRSDEDQNSQAGKGHRH